jgi:uncharacterized membrane protein
MPSVQWSVPSDNDYNVRVTTLIKIKLSETLDIARIPVNLTTFQLLDSQYRPLDGEIRYDPVESLIIFVPTGILDFGQTYSIMLLNTLVDLAGNTLDGNGNDLPDDNDDIFKVIFRTTNITTIPDNFQEGISLGSSISAKFSGNISEQSLNTLDITVKEQKTGVSIDGTISIDIQNYSIEFKPGSKLKKNRFYVVNVSIKFYLIPSGSIIGDSTHRERLIDNGNQSEIDENNTVTNIYSWTFKTEDVDDGQGDGLFGGYLMMVMLGIILLIIIVLIISILVINRQKRKREASGEGEFSVLDEYGEFDDEYDDEYAQVYGERPSSTKAKSVQARRRGRRATVKSSSSRRSKKIHKPKTRKSSARRKRRAEDDDFEYEDEDVWDPDEEEEYSDDGSFDFEDEYISGFDEEPQDDFDIEEEDYEEEEAEGDFEIEFDDAVEEDEEFAIMEDEEQEFDEIEELDEFDEEELDELEEIEELDDAEELEELEEMEELEELEE